MTASAGRNSGGDGGRARRVRAALEAAGWLLLVALLWGTDLAVKFAERDALGLGKSDFRLVVEQVTSGLGVLAMIPFVVAWLRLFPLKPGAWVAALVGHAVGSVIFAAGHYTLMVIARAAVYAIRDLPYIWREPFFSNLLVEYQKDIKVYLGIVAVIIAYRYFRPSRDGAEVRGTGPQRLVVQTGKGTAVLRFEQIDYLAAARNYVSVHAEGREYVVRETMANLMLQLAEGPFARTHRSYIVNIDRIAEIRSEDSRHVVVLDSGERLPLSRGYRDQFRERIGG